MSITIHIPNKTDKPQVEFLTISEVTKLCGRSKHSFIKLIDRGIMPDANFRTANKKIKRGLNKGNTIKGDRLYSKDFLVPKVVKIFKEIQQGKVITPEQRLELCTAFVDERNYYINEY